MDRNLSALEVKLWGEFACFARPEMKVERVSYPVMTPSAARGALEAIFWKPEVAWNIEEIRVLRPVVIHTPPAPNTPPKDPNKNQTTPQTILMNNQG